MKNRLICLLILMIFIISIFNNTAYAGFHYTLYVGPRQPISRINENVGKAAGQYYTTEIRAFLNYTEIESYNIGGRTLVCHPTNNQSIVG